MSPEAGASAPVVEVRDLERAFGEVRALRGVSFAVPRGSIVGFLGPNGAGKTTAIRVLTGFLAPTAGAARVCGFDVAAEPLEVQRRVGYLPENNPLWLDMPVDAFLRFAARARGLRGAEARSALERVAPQCGLEPVWRRPLGACSKGFRQRAGLAQALLHDPELLVLDEPTNGLDPLQVLEMRELIRELGRRKSVILTSHVLPEVEAVAERVVLIHRGRVVADGALSELGRGGGALRLRISVRGGEEALRRAVEDAGARWRERLAGTFGDGCCTASAEAPDAGTLARLSAAAAAAGLPLLELAPEAGGLEALFRRLLQQEEAA